MAAWPQSWHETNCLHETGYFVFSWPKLGVWLCVVVLLQGQQINEAACDLAREVANEGDALVAGGVSQTPSYLSCKSEDDVKAIFKKQIDVFVTKDVDFLIAEVCKHLSPPTPIL